MTFSGARRSPFVPTQAYYAAADEAGDDAYYYAAAGDDVRRPRARYRLFFGTPSLAFVWASCRGPNGRPDGPCTWNSCPLAIDAPPRRRGGCRESAVVHRWLPAQAPAYYYYTAADDSTYGYDDSAYAYGYDDAYGHAQCTKSNIVAARLRHGLHAINATPARWRGGVVSLRSIQPARRHFRRERTQ